MGLHSVKRDFFNFSVARKRKDALFFFFYRVCSLWLILAYEDFLVL